MAKNDTPRWIRTASGYAGRNGYITHTSGGCFVKAYDTDCSPVYASKFFRLIGEAKRFLDGDDLSDLSPTIEEARGAMELLAAITEALSKSETSDETEQVADTENTD